MGCGGSTAVVDVHPGYAEILAIQSATRAVFRTDRNLLGALDFIMFKVTTDAAGLPPADGHAAPLLEPKPLEELVAKVASDKRDLFRMEGRPDRVPDGCIASNLELMQISIARKVRPTVRPEIEKLVSSKIKEPREREEMAEQSLMAAVSICLIQEVFEFFAARHYGAPQAEPGHTSRGLAPLEAQPHAPATDQQQQREVHEDPNASNDEAASPLLPPSSGPEASDRGSGKPANDDQPPVVAAAANADVPHEESPPAEGDDVAVAAASADEDELRYPLPEGDWVKSTPDFYWSEEQQLFYFPAAGHFTDPTSGQWYIPDTGEWIDAEAHERLLNEMAARGDY